MQWYKMDITKHNLFEFKELFAFQVQVAMGIPKTQTTLKLNVPETQVI